LIGGDADGGYVRNEESAARRGHLALLPGEKLIGPFHFR